FTRSYDALVFSMDGFVPDGLDRGRVQVFPPSIDPLSAKNSELAPERVADLLAELDDEEINALQRGAAVVVQKSLREGYGLTVSEALSKGRPVVAGHT